MPDEIRLAASELLDRGFSVIPIKHGTKKPLIKWEEFQHRQATEDEVEAWFHQWPDAQLALVTGSISGLVVVDADGQDGIAWIKANMPRTGVYQRTRKGYHAFYRLNGTPARNGVRIAPEVDVRGEGGYVLIAPSEHPDGGQYELVYLQGLDGWDDLADFELPACITGEVKEKEPVEIREVQQGERNNELVRVVGKYLNLGMALDAALCLALGWNTQHCRPPLDRGEIEQTVKSIYRTHKSNHPFEDDFDFEMKLPDSPESIHVFTEIHEVTENHGAHSVHDDSRGIHDRFTETHERESNVNYTKKQPATPCLAHLVEDWVNESSGIFNGSDIDREFGLVTPQGKANRRKILEKLVKDGLIEREIGRKGVYRVIDRAAGYIDIFSANTDVYPLLWPLDLQEKVNIMPGNIIIVAGETNGGKTAFLLNFVLMNLRNEALAAYMTENNGGQKVVPPPHPPLKNNTLNTAMNWIPYFSSEMGASELRGRLKNFRLPLESWAGLYPLERSRDFHDVIWPNGINVVDYMECSEEFYKIGGYIRQIHEKLDKGICIIALQKKEGADYGRGGEFTAEKARLYLSLKEQVKTFNTIKIVKAKSFFGQNPNGQQMDFRITRGGSELVPSDYGWEYLNEKERKKRNEQYEEILKLEAAHG